MAITITDASGCAVSPDTVPAGPVTFTITNVDAAGITEVELLSDQRIRGERENLAPGFDDSFSATLDGGTYQIYCPGAKTEKVNLTVTGQTTAPSGDVADLLKQATVDYADYVDTQTAMLVPAVEELQKAIASGDLKAAQEAYAKARPYYERIEPVAESFGDLDPEIDARAGDVPANEWTGFHPIEKALFEEKTTAGLSALATKLVTDSKDLQTRAAQLTANTKSGTGDGYKPDEVANGAVELLSEVQQSKITGEEERYSHIDLLDFSANVEGSLQAFAALKPALDQIDSTVVPNISAKVRPAHRGSGHLPQRHRPRRIRALHGPQAGRHEEADRLVARGDRAHVGVVRKDRYGLTRRERGARCAHHRTQQRHRRRQSTITG